jgi:FixJ family two-component response regulator
MIDDFTVFVVDDNAGIRKSLKNLCDAEGLPVETYGSAEEFLTACDPSRHGCLLLDVRLGKSSGLDLLDKLRERNTRLSTLIITAYGNVPMSVRAIKAGAVDFLQKPVAPEVLLKHIRNSMEIDRQQRQSAAPREDLRRRIASLTSRERQVLDRIVQGMASKEIATDLGVSTRTVEGHRRGVLRKIGSSSAAQLVRAVLFAGD